MTARGRFAVAIAVLCSGCMPHVMHGPRVDDDRVSGSVSLTLGRNREVGDLESRILPSLYGGLRRSWLPSDGDGLAGSFGIQVPLLLAPVLVDSDVDGPDRLEALLATTYVDAYLQPKRRVDPGWETGLGVLASTALAGPYLQAGRLNADGQGWYTTQLVAVMIGDDLGEGTIYMPTIIWRDRDEAGSSAVNFSLGLGVPFGEDTREMLIIAGLTFELGLRRN